MPSRRTTQAAAARRLRRRAVTRATPRASATWRSLERAFARGRRGRVDASQHRETLARARVMMGSEQLKAFDVSQEPAERSLRIRRFSVRPRLPGGPATDRGRRALRRGHAGRLGRPRQQPRCSRPEVKDARPGVRRTRCATFASKAARSHHRRLLRRVRPNAQDQPVRRPRPLAHRLQPRTRRRLPSAAAWPSARPIPRESKDPVRPTPGRRRARDGALGPGPQSGQGKRGPATSRPIKLSAGKPIRELLG